MIKKRIRKRIRVFKRWLHKRRFAIVICAVVLFMGALSYASYMQNRRLSVDPTSYQSLLQLIAKAESNGNYNAYFGNAGNTSIDFTKMSIAEVQKWQEEYVRSGKASSAVGRYQIINTTLAGLVRQLKIDTVQPFDQALQDRLAITLLERRGAERYINKEITREQFAAELAKEWAALPRMTGPNPGDSYYASDGLNKSRVSVDEILRAIDPLQPK